MINRNDSMSNPRDVSDDSRALAAERARESVSALFDGEADELELRRLLAHPQPELIRGAWRDYQLQRDALQNVDGRFASFDISAQVQAAIADDAVPSVAVGGARWWRPLASMAVAASVATVVVIGARAFNPLTGFAVGRDGGSLAQSSISTNNSFAVNSSFTPNGVANSAAANGAATGTISAKLGRVYPASVNTANGNATIDAQSFAALSSGNGLPGTVFPRNEVVGKSFPGVQTVSFDADQAAQQRLQQYLQRHGDRAALNNGQGVINFAKVSQLNME